MNLEQAIATGKTFEATHESNLAHNRVELFIDPRHRTYHLEVVHNIAKDPYTLDTASLAILKTYLLVELGVNPEDSIWIEKATFSKGSPPIEETGAMTLWQALSSGKPFETNFATSMERGWITMIVRPQGDAFHLEVVYDITEQPLTLDGDASAIVTFVRTEQGIEPSANVWVEVPASRWPLEADTNEWLMDRREI
jgi:hypothetical protein